MNDHSTASETAKQAETSLGQALFPIAVLVALMVYGLILRPPNAQLPLEIIFILAAMLTVAHLVWRGHRWGDIQEAIVAKLASALPAFFILFSIGLIIGSWMVCGTIPMLVYYGLNLIHPSYLYIVAFVAPVIFSTLTGTSWGSVGTIGVVIMGIANALEANLGIVAGAIIGGAYFGDKMSPLSDTTNLAALAAGSRLFDHIHAMMFTTFPSAIFAASAYFALGFIYPPSVTTADMQLLDPFLHSLESAFRFHVLLLVPPIVVLVGSIFRKPIVPTLLSGSLVACLLAWWLQPFTVTDIVQTMHKGFTVEMISADASVTENVAILVQRGGLYELNEAIITALMVFIFIGAMDYIRAMPTVVNHLLRHVKTRTGTIIASLVASGFTIAATSNQYATSFIVGDAFQTRYDRFGIPRKVLSRSLEDYGTMVESIVPWTACTIYMVNTLNVPFSEYWNWQLLSLANLVVAPLLAVTGWGCFLSKPNENLNGDA